MTLKNVTDDELARLAKLGLVAVKQGELLQRVKQGILDADWTLGELQRLIEGKLGDAASQLTSWVEFYQKRGIQLDAGVVLIPEKRPGFDRLIVVAQGVAPQWSYDECKKLFLCWKWTNNLDEIVQSVRMAKNGPYAIWVRERVEADEELKDLSANVLEKRKIAGITLEERLVYESKYFKETGKHLDIKNLTLCSGSRDSVGFVPIVYWNDFDGELHVVWFDPGHHDGDLRARAAVS